MTARISDEKITELKQAVDIVDIVSDYVQLKKQGRNYFGLCPFHGENTPSFSVSQEKQIFHCFGCGAGGSAFTFLMDIEGVGFQEAAEMIADKGGVELEIEPKGGSRSPQLPENHQKIIDAHELLAKFYHHLLLHTNEGSRALEYLLDRGFTKESIEKFGIGYSLAEWDFAVKYLEKRGFPNELAELAGIAGKRERDGTYYDRFRNRIMFPLSDEKGRVIGFSARALDAEDHPKYLNTPETPLFNKSSLLYNFSGAKGQVRRQGSAVLMEGFADVISADAAGVQNAVAVMGTALTPEHVKKMRKLTDTVILCLDSDDAGIEAAFRSGSMLSEQRMTVKAALLPEGKDPDEYIRRSGAEAFRDKVIGNAMTWTSFKLFYLRRKKNLQNEGEKLKYIEEVLTEISKLSNAVEQDMYLRQLAEEFTLSLGALQQQLEDMIPAKKNPPKTKYQKPAMAQEQAEKPKRMPSAAEQAERQLLARMLRDAELAYKVKGMLGNKGFHFDEHQAILTYLFGFYEEGSQPDPSNFLNYLPDPQLRRTATEIAMLEINEEYTERELEDYVGYVLKYPKLLMIKEKQAEQKHAERKNDLEKAIQIAMEIIELRKSL